MQADKRLVYFDVYARAESIRMLLSHARVQYVDERLDEVKFAQKKEEGELPNGQVPIWVQQGQTFTETRSILRMLGW